jgi:hypothetical protein
MPLQDIDRLVMGGLGIAGDHPPNSLQPTLPDSVLLRWAQPLARGFPWFGYFLFRRPHERGTPVCLSAGLGSVTVGPQSGASLSTVNGDVTSDVNLLTTDDFAPLGTPEFDLAGRAFVKVILPAGRRARRVIVTVGFREASGPVGPVVVDFTGRVEATLDNPYTEQGATFTAQSASGPAAHNAIVLVTTVGGPATGLDCQRELAVDLPRPSSFVEVDVSATTPPAVVTAYDGNGRAVGRATISTSQHRTTARFTRGPLTRVVVTAANGGAALHRISYDRVLALPSAPVTALLGGVPVVQTSVSGDPGRTAAIELRFDAIDAVQIGTAAGALVDVCYVTIASDATTGWARVPADPQPITLPLTHQDYEAAKAPEDEAAAKTMAVDRIRFGPTDVWEDSFHDLYTLLVALVAGGPNGTPMAQKTIQFADAVPPFIPNPDPQDPVLSLKPQSPLQLVLLGALHPAVAQMLGLYWVDLTVAGTAPQTYDYLIVADDTGSGNLNADHVLDEIRSVGFASLDGWICYDLGSLPAPVDSPPQEVRVFALPGATMESRTGDLIDATNNAGLTWLRPTYPIPSSTSARVLPPGAPVFFHLWRHALGNGLEPDAEPDPTSYDSLTENRPILLATPKTPLNPQRSSSWPPIALQTIDRGLTDGWYSYRLSSVDLFGRGTPLSASAAWYQWEPEPNPRPWYYQPGQGDALIHDYAVRLIDTTGPPFPLGIEATALDRDDPWLQRDATCDNWFTQTPAGVVGLRLRWRWTKAHMDQAPDTREFRIYYQPGRLNALIGRITSVTPEGASESWVVTDIANTRVADAYAGASLRIGSDAFVIVGSDAGSPVRVRVRNVGPNDDVRPTTAPCSIVIPALYSRGTASVTHGSAVVTGTGTDWNATLAGMSFQVVEDLATYRVQSVDGPRQITLDRPYAGPSADPKAYGISFPPFTDFSVPTAWRERLYVVAYDDPYPGPLPVPDPPDPRHAPRFRVEGTTRVYEIFLPYAFDSIQTGLERPDLLFTPTLDDPLVYGHIGISAADNKDSTDDALQWSYGAWGSRKGNEGRVGPPATIYRVRRDPPPAPAVPAFDKRVFASRADYQHQSYYTYRWLPVSPSVACHIYRALDETLVAVDWDRRVLGMPKPEGDPHVPLPNLDGDLDLAVFPVEWRDAGHDARRAGIASAINTINALAPDTDRDVALVEYRKLRDDALRVLAGLPDIVDAQGKVLVFGNHKAFAQLTLEPLDPTDPANANRLGPDDPLGFSIDPCLRAYVDVLDGRSRNRYFYRAAFVDAAHNKSALSLSGPPIYLPKVTAPMTPVITKVLAEEKAIQLRWVSNQEADLAAYRVYRTDREEAARDLRLMTLMDTVAAEELENRPTQVSWTDAGLPGLTTFHYRLVAVDELGNASAPSRVVIAHAYDESFPTAPTPSLAWVDEDGMLRAQAMWSSVDETRLQSREITKVTWGDRTAWRPPGSYVFTDLLSDSARSYEYRLWARSNTGAIAAGQPVSLAAIP